MASSEGLTADSQDSMDPKYMEMFIRLNMAKKDR